MAEKNDALNQEMAKAEQLMGWYRVATVDVPRFAQSASLAGEAFQAAWLRITAEENTLTATSMGRRLKRREMERAATAIALEAWHAAFAERPAPDITTPTEE